MRPRPVHYALTAPAQLLLAGFILIPSLYVGWLSLHSEEVPANGTPLSVLILRGSPHSWNSRVKTQYC